MEPILRVAREVLPASGLLLEIASGSGEHAAELARALPGLEVQPSDVDAEARASIDAHREAARLANLRAPVALDVRGPWPVERADAVVCINMIHIAPWEATLGLLKGASRVLAQGAPLFLYGPYLRDGVATAQSNLDFDASLRARDERWGLRRLEDVAAAARERGFGEPQIHEMPANNLAVVFTRTLP